MLWTSRVGERRSIPTFFFLSLFLSSFFLAAAVKFVSLSLERVEKRRIFNNETSPRGSGGVYSLFFSPNERKRLAD
jgi:hypothetical protein